MLELRLTFQLPNDRLNEHPFLEHQGIKIRQRFRLHVLANFVNQVNTFGLQRLTQLFGDIPFYLRKVYQIPDVLTPEQGICHRYCRMSDTPLAAHRVY